MAQSAATSHWLCQACHRPAPDGIIEIINTNIDLGPIGSYPVEATPDRAATERAYLDDIRKERGIPDGEPFAFSAADLARLVVPQHNLGFVIRHLECTADKKIQGYWFSAREAATLEHYVNWILHLGEKTWMGREDIVSMLYFWWAHKGQRPPRDS